jgi:hypothetical protein
MLCQFDYSPLRAHPQLLIHTGTHASVTNCIQLITRVRVWDPVAKHVLKIATPPLASTAPADLLAPQLHYSKSVLQRALTRVCRRVYAQKYDIDFTTKYIVCVHTLNQAPSPRTVQQYAPSTADNGYKLRTSIVWGIHNQ